jgi:dihydroxy-acid dehydratase
LKALENVACPGAGACGGQYTANTMSTVMELIGLSPMGFNSVPALSPEKDTVALAVRRSGDEACCATACVRWTS